MIALDERGYQGCVVDVPVLRVHLVLPCDRAAPRAVRRELDRMALPPELEANAKLVATEMVTNAVRHSGALPGDTIEVIATLREGRLDLSVRDAGRSEDGPTTREGGDEDGGFGLQIIDRIASRWGVEQGGGRRVWVELLS